MCSINLVLGKDFKTVCDMNEATKRRGIHTTVRNIKGYHLPAWVAYNHLPTTDNSNAGAFETENYIVWLNGFISNHKELSDKYKMSRYTSRDTEVLARFIELKKGNDLSELNGFFAVVYYDKVNEVFNAFTDRYGIKQLYSYVDSDGNTFISSEVKGILSVCPEIEVDKKALKDWYYSLGVMTDNTIYKGIERIRKIEMPIIERSTDISPIAYDKAKRQLKRLLTKSFDRNAYDGPIGVYLSGGIDSGILANWANVDYCFSVDYVNDSYSEIENIKLNSIGQHLTLIINDENSMQYALKSIEALDDLKAGSCYTNFAITELASKFVRVVYSGAGGDEFFGGYPHRLNRSIDEVIRRDDNLPLENFNISHFEYDLKFLQAVLIVEDRMSGYHTMETRYPLLDNDLVNFALSLPISFIENKQILKEISGLSFEVQFGKKKGFSNPDFSNKEWTEFVINFKKL